MTADSKINIDYPMTSEQFSTRFCRWNQSCLCHNLESIFANQRRSSTTGRILENLLYRCCLDQTFLKYRENHYIITLSHKCANSLNAHDIPCVGYIVTIFLYIIISNNYTLSVLCWHFKTFYSFSSPSEHFPFVKCHLFVSCAVWSMLPIGKQSLQLVCDK